MSNQPTVVYRDSVLEALKLLGLNTDLLENQNIVNVDISNDRILVTREYLVVPGGPKEISKTA